MKDDAPVNERPMSDNVEAMSHTQGSNVMLAIIIRIVISFIFGYLFAFVFFYLSQHDILRGSSNTLEGIALSFPLIVGILAPVTMDRRSKHLIFPSVLVALSALVGAYVCLLPPAMQSDDRIINYYHHGIALAVALLDYAMLAGIVLVLICTVIIGLIIKGIRKYSQRPMPR